MEKEEILINTQFAMFFEQPIARTDLLVSELNNVMGNIFDQIPIIIPVPPDLVDVPVVQMNSSNGVYSLNIARGRADFFHAGVGKQKFADIKNDFQGEVEKLFNFFSNKFKIKRIGFVTRFFFEEEKQDEIISKLIDKNFRDLHNGKTQEAYVRYVSRINFNDLEVNNFTAIERFFARISGLGDNIKGILVTRDFNTIPEKNYSDYFNKEKIKDFIAKSEGQFNLDKIKDILWSKEKK
jgi:hypothetical protein